MDSAIKGPQRPESEVKLLDEINRYLFGDREVKSFCNQESTDQHPEKYALATSFASLLCSDSTSITTHHLKLLQKRLSPQEILMITEHVLVLLGKQRALNRIRKMVETVS